MNFGEMQRQSWALTSEGDVVADNNVGGDDDDDVQLGNNTFYKRNARIAKDADEEDGEEQLTLKAEHPPKTARQSMIERKLHEADVRAQAFT